MSSGRSIPCPIRARASRAPHSPALLAPGWNLDYAGFDRAVDALAGRLAARGVARGSRVVSELASGPEQVLMAGACLRLGAVICPLNSRLPEAMLHAQTVLVSPALCVVDRPAGPSASATELTWEELTSVPESAAGGGDARLRPSDPWTLVFTSGSGGRPRAALHSVANHTTSALGSNSNIPVRPDDRWLMALPLYHVGGLAILMRCWIAGGAVVFGEPQRSLAGTLAEGRITHVSLVATQLRRLLDGPLSDAWFRNLQAVLLGGGPIPESDLRRAHAIGLPIHVSYGSTEMTSQVTTSPPGASIEELVRSSGRLLAYRDLRVGPGGELFVRGATRFLGYVTADGIERPFDASGWFATGDLGQVDQAGRLTVVGRKDHMFISGGENIHPEAIERALLLVSAIRRAVVVPVPDAEFGARPVAFVDPPVPEAALPQVRSELEGRLPRYMLPVRFFPWPEEGSEAMKPNREAFTRRAVRQMGGEPEGRPENREGHEGV